MNIWTIEYTTKIAAGPEVLWISDGLVPEQYFFFSARTIPRPVWYSQCLLRSLYPCLSPFPSTH